MWGDGVIGTKSNYRVINAIKKNEEMKVKRAEICEWGKMERGMGTTIDDDMTNNNNKFV